MEKKKYNIKTSWKSYYVMFQEPHELGFWLTYDILIDNWRIVRIGLYSSDKDGYESHQLADIQNHIETGLLNRIALAEIANCLEFELELDKDTIIGNSFIGEIRRSLWEYISEMPSIEVIEHENRVTVYRKPIKPIGEAKGKQVLEKLGANLENIIQEL